MTHNHPISCDIFCRVIDNYGDIGVCWRLARQLTNEHSFNVRLWVDELAALNHLWPETLITNQQWLAGVDVRQWREPFARVEPARVVIEAFACELPLDYLAAMKHQSVAPYWFNLEYLSAEAWVDDCHGMRSVHPTLGLSKTFFFPGFSPRSGGILREGNLALDREFFTDSGQPDVFLGKLGLESRPQGLLVSLFGYENKAIGSLLDAWQTSALSVTCLLPVGRILSSVNSHLNRALTVGDSFKQGNLHLKVIPFLQQEDYDRLLWTCDINFIRGEDSFVRAQWAAKPLIWHIYPQEQDAHLVKLDAFLGRYTQGLNPALAQALTDLWQTWNRCEDCHAAWNLCIGRLSEWQIHARAWEQQLDSREDLATKLVGWCKKPL